MSEIEYLKFEDWQKEVSRNRLNDVWLVVYSFKKESDREHNGEYATFCAILPNKEDLIKKVLMNSSWEISYDYGCPEFWLDMREGKIHYERFGSSFNEIPFEPLVICRSFYGLREDSVELSEEFRLYHNLYHDRRKDEFIFIDESGEEDVAAKIEKTDDDFVVSIKIRYLRDFLAAKNTVLIRFHDHIRYSRRDLTKDLGTDIIRLKGAGENFCYEIIINPKPELAIKNWMAFSRFLAKDVLPPFQEPCHSEYKLLKGEKTKAYEKFIVGVDDEGRPIERSCDPRNLSVKEYLTPVFFKREVLKKYYDQPSKYTVGDNYLSCGTLWGMRYGQNPRLVHAWLGDLGEYLPHNEQLHWKQFNVPPEGELGPATIKRELLAEPSEPDETTHKFKYEFEKFSEFWKDKFGWYLFLPLRKDDEHFMKSLHVPVSEEPLEFDQQILALAKILPDLLL